MRRTYGSEIFNLIDAPANRETALDIMAATIDALRKWEPRIYPQQVRVETFAPGHLTIGLTALYIPDGKIVTLDGIAIA